MSDTNLWMIEKMTKKPTSQNSKIRSSLISKHTTKIQRNFTQLSSQTKSPKMPSTRSWRKTPNGQSSQWCSCSSILQSIYSLSTWVSLVSLSFYCHLGSRLLWMRASLETLITQLFIRSLSLLFWVSLPMIFLCSSTLGGKVRTFRCWKVTKTRD